MRSNSFGPADRGRPARAPQPGAPSGEIRTLQYGRGAAAALVVLFHADALAAKYFGGSAAGSAFRGGHSGVEFFFVLSGFIILAAHRGDVGRVARLRPYLVKRFVRLAPLYWLVMIPYGAAFLLVPSLNAERGVTPLGILRDTLLLSPETVLTLPPAWTLQHEVLFYLVFALAIVDRRLGMAVFGLWQAGCAGFLLFSTALHTYAPPADTVLGYFNLGFLFGIGLALPAVRGLIAERRGPALALGGCGVAITAALLTAEALSTPLGPPALDTLAYFVGYGLIIVGLLAVPNVPRPKLDATLGLLGSASYAMYLVHLPVGSLTLKVLTAPALARAVSPTVAFLAVSAAGLAAGLALHLAVERPLLRALRARIMPAAGRLRPASWGAVPPFEREGASPRA